MNCLEIPLDITSVTIDNIKFTEEGEIFVTITSMIEDRRNSLSGFYGEDREIILRHLSILRKPTYLKRGLKPCPIFGVHYTR